MTADNPTGGVKRRNFPNRRVQGLRTVRSRSRRRARPVMISTWAILPLVMAKLSARSKRPRGAHVTRMSDRPDPVPDGIWEEAARHYSEPELTGLILWIALTNVWNRLNVTTKQVAGEWAKSAEARKWVETAVSSR